MARRGMRWWERLQARLAERGPAHHLDRWSRAPLDAACFEPDVANGRAFARDASTWRRLGFLSKMFLPRPAGPWGSSGLKLTEVTPDDDAPELLCLGDVLWVPGLATALSDRLLARLSRASLIYFNLEGVVGAEGIELRPVQTWAGLSQLLGWSRKQDLGAWGSVFAANDLEGLLERLPPAVVGVANNHALDRERAGLDATVAWLRARGCAVVGAPGCAHELVSCGGWRLGWFGLTFGYNNMAGDADQGRFVDVPYVIDEGEVRRTVKTLRDRGAEWIAVTPHWGYEYERTPRADQLACVEGWWAAGVDAVVGHHPHLPQPMRFRGDRVAAFSLGDVVGGDRNVLSRYAVALSVKRTRQGVRYGVLPLMQRSYRDDCARVSLLDEGTDAEKAMFNRLYGCWFD